MTFGGSKMQNNIKIQDEHGQILVSGALNPRKTIYEQILKISGGLQPKKPNNYGKY